MESEINIYYQELIKICFSSKLMQISKKSKKLYQPKYFF